VNTESDPLNCGECGSACPEGETCIVGQCSGAVGDDCTSTLAHGINVTEIAVYQAGKISIMKDGLALASDERDVDVVAGKNAVVRVFVGLEEGFTNRVLSARLSLIEGEEVERLFHKRTVDSPTVENSLGTSFNIEVDGDLIKPSTRYAIEIVECGADSGTEASPRFPAAGDEALEARDVGIVRLEDPAGRLPQLRTQAIGMGSAQRVGDDDAFDHVGEHRRAGTPVDAHGDDRAGVGAAPDRPIEPDEPRRTSIARGDQPPAARLPGECSRRGGKVDRRGRFHT